jgi:hypothetical protein
MEAGRSGLSPGLSDTLERDHEQHWLGSSPGVDPETEDVIGIVTRTDLIGTLNINGNPFLKPKWLKRSTRH